MVLGGTKLLVLWIIFVVSIRNVPATACFLWVACFQWLLTRNTHTIPCIIHWPIDQRLPFKMQAHHLIVFNLTCSQCGNCKGQSRQQAEFFVESSALLMETSVRANQTGSMIYSCVRLRSSCRVYPGFEGDKCFRSRELVEKEIR